MLVLTGMNYAEKNTLYEQAKKSLKTFKGDQAEYKLNSGTAATKLDATYLAANEDVLLAAGYVHQSATSNSRWRS